MKTIAVDWDNTYSLAPAMWDRVIETFKAHNFRVLIVTCRQDTEENVIECKAPGCSTVFTRATPKRWFMKEQRGIEVDVWIDDQPESIIYGK
jgi:hypothetical protein